MTFFVEVELEGRGLFSAGDVGQEIMEYFLSQGHLSQQPLSSSLCRLGPDSVGGSACRLCCHGAHATVHGVRHGPGLTRNEISGLYVFFFMCSSWQILSYFCDNIILTVCTVLSLVDNKEQC